MMDLNPSASSDTFSSSSLVLEEVESSPLLPLILLLFLDRICFGSGTKSSLSETLASTSPSTPSIDEVVELEVEVDVDEVEDSVNFLALPRLFDACSFFSLFLIILVENLAVSYPGLVDVIVNSKSLLTISDNSSSIVQGRES